jgi:hypothetical protein
MAIVAQCHNVHSVRDPCVYNRKWQAAFIIDVVVPRAALQLFIHSFFPSKDKHTGKGGGGEGVESLNGREIRAVYEVTNVFSAGVDLAICVRI